MDKTTIKIFYDPDDDVTSDERCEEEFSIPTHFMWMWKAFIKCMTTAAAKNHDYSQGEEWYHNFSGGGLKGIVNRMSDKFQRLINLLKRDGKMEVRESFEDTCLDLATYAVILFGAFEEGLTLEGELWNDG